MANLFSAEIHRKYDKYHLKRKEWTFLFRAFGLQYQEVCDIFDVYMELDTDGTGGVDVNEFMDYFGVDGSRQFGARLFTIVDLDGSGEVDFLEFTIVLWLFCTLTADTMGDFLFDLYDADKSGEIDLDELSGMMADLMGKTELGRSKTETKRIVAHVQAEVEKMLDLVQQESGHVLKGNRLDRDAFIELIDIHFDLLSPVYEFQRALRAKACGLKFWRSKITYRKKDEKIKETQLSWNFDETYAPAKAVGVRRGMRVSERIIKIRPWLENLQKLEENETLMKRRYLKGEITNSGKEIRQPVMVTVECKLGRPLGVEFDENSLVVLRVEKPKSSKKSFDTNDPAMTAAWEAGVRRGMKIIKVGRGESAQERVKRLKKEARIAKKKAADDSVKSRTKEELEEKRRRDEEKAIEEENKKKAKATAILLGRSVTSGESIDEAIEYYRERGELDLTYTFRVSYKDGMFFLHNNIYRHRQAYRAHFLCI